MDQLLEKITDISKNTLSEQLGIEYLNASKDCVQARMPVDHRTIQPYGLLHGGATAALAETLASVGGILNVEEDMGIVGLTVIVNHIRSAKSGWVMGKAVPIHIGRRTQIWEIKISNEQDQLISDCRCTLVNIRQHG